MSLLPEAVGTFAAMESNTANSVTARRINELIATFLFKEIWGKEIKPTRADNNADGDSTLCAANVQKASMMSLNCLTCRKLAECNAILGLVLAEPLIQPSGAPNAALFACLVPPANDFLDGLLKRRRNSTDPSHLRHRAAGS